MTHILSNPGYPHGSNRLYRAKSADIYENVLRRNAHESFSNRDELNRIRSLSRQAWKNEWEDPGVPELKKPEHYTTTYGFNFSKKRLSEPTKSRPTSPTRRNNPHPTRVFLHNHLREAPGFKTHRVKTGQDPYRGLGHRPKPAPIDMQRTMYYTEHEIYDLQKQRRAEELKSLLHPVSWQATQAWLRMAPEKDKRIVENMLMSADEDQEFQETLQETFKPEVVVSVNRWLKKAGKEEETAVKRLVRTLATDPMKNGYIDPTKTGTLPRDRYILGRYGDVKHQSHRLIHRPQYNLHPEWLTAE